MDDVTRRGFVKTGAGAAAGLVAFGTLDAAEAEARAHHHGHQGHPIVAWIGDPRDGRITVMSGKTEVTIRDHKLAGHIARAARAAK
jgi:hypothetical protein